jgi:hypothetical protein
MLSMILTLTSKFIGNLRKNLFFLSLFFVILFLFVFFKKVKQTDCFTKDKTTGGVIFFRRLASQLEGRDYLDLYSNK